MGWIYPHSCQRTKRVRVWYRNEEERILLQPILRQLVYEGNVLGPTYNSNQYTAIETGEWVWFPFATKEEVLSYYGYLGHETSWV